MASSPLAAVANSISRRHFSAVAGRADRLQTKSPRSRTRSCGEEKEVVRFFRDFWKWWTILFVIGGNRTVARNDAGGRLRYVHERVYIRMYNECVVYFTRWLLCISWPDEKFISRSTPRHGGKSFAITGCATPAFFRRAKSRINRRDRKLCDLEIRIGWSSAVVNKLITQIAHLNCMQYDVGMIWSTVKLTRSWYSANTEAHIRFTSSVKCRLVETKLPLLAYAMRF